MNILKHILPLLASLLLAAIATITPATAATLPGDAPTGHQAGLPMMRIASRDDDGRGDGRGDGDGGDQSCKGHRSEHDNQPNPHDDGGDHDGRHEHHGCNLTVAAVAPTDGAVGVCPSASISATFSAPSSLRMDPLTINTFTFTVTGPGSAPVAAASVVLDAATGRIATFTPQSLLAPGVSYTATILGGANGVKDLATPADQLDAKSVTWKFTAGSATGNCAAAVTGVNMGTAASFAIAATAGITNTPTAPITLINGDVVLDPLATCNAVPVDNAGGFGICGGAAPTLNGIVITPTYPDTTTAAQVDADLNAAFLSITPPAGPPAVGSLGGGTPIAAPTTLGAASGSALVLGHNWFTPGVYTSITSILITGDLTLDAQGNPNAVFVFQSASTLTTAAGAPSPGAHTRILLINGAKASNVWWQVSSSATIGTYSEFQGNILAAFDITLLTGVHSCGRLMAGAWVGGTGALVFDSNVVSVPGNGCPL